MADPIEENGMAIRHGMLVPDETLERSKPEVVDSSETYCRCGHINDDDQHACPITYQRLNARYAEALGNYANQNREMTKLRAERDTWQARAMALFYGGDPDKVTCGEIRKAADVYNAWLRELWNGSSAPETTVQPVAYLKEWIEKSEWSERKGERRRRVDLTPQLEAWMDDGKVTPLYARSVVEPPALCGTCGEAHEPGRYYNHNTVKSNAERPDG